MTQQPALFMFSSTEAASNLARLLRDAVTATEYMADGLSGDTTFTEQLRKRALTMQEWSDIFDDFVSAVAKVEC